MNKLLDAQLEAMYKLIHQDSHTEALRAIYEAGCDWGQANPPVTVIDVPAASTDPFASVQPVSV